MRGRLKVFMTFIMVAAICVVAPLSCGGSTTTAGDVIHIGWLGDASGPAQAAMEPVRSGLLDYLAMAEEEGLLGDTEIKVSYYDTRTDYGRVPIGYNQLKNKGVDFMLIPNPSEIECILDRLEADKMPVMTSVSINSILDHPWVFCHMMLIEDQTDIIFKWITEDWDYDAMGRNPKVAHVGSDSLSSISAQAQVDRFLAANPGVIDFKGARQAPMTATTWAGEVVFAQDADYVMTSMVATGTATFIKELRAKGSTAKLVSGTSSIPGYWNLIQSVVPAEQLGKTIHMHAIPWVGDGQFATEYRAGIAKYHTASYAEYEGGQSSYPTGWAVGIWLVDVVQRASEVGRENLDGSKLRDLLEETDITLEGWGSPWKLSPEEHVCAKSGMLFEWKVDQAEWVAVSDWILPGLD